MAPTHASQQHCVGARAWWLVLPADEQLEEMVLQELAPLCCLDPLQELGPLLSALPTLFWVLPFIPGVSSNPKPSVQAHIPVPVLAPAMTWLRFTGLASFTPLEAALYYPLNNTRGKSPDCKASPVLD